jgi:hypothetical protein
MTRFFKYTFGSIYTYGFVRGFYYNDKLKEHDYSILNKRNQYKDLLLGDKILNIVLSTFFAFPLFTGYIIDDLNAYDAMKKNIKYEDKMFPFSGKFIINYEEKE